MLVEKLNGRLYARKPGIEFYTCSIRTKEQYFRLKKILQQIRSSKRESFLFRGQSNFKWHLTPTLEREIAKVTDIHTFFASAEKFLYERAFLTSDFFQSLLRWDSQVKDLNTAWLRFAYVQHHGGPTRLLDFTSEIDYALFFAINTLPDTDSAIWLINGSTLKLLSIQKIEGDDSNLFDLDQEHIIELTYQGVGEGLLGVHILEDFGQKNLFTRLKNQKGLFLYPTNFKRTFEQNLFNLEHSEESPPPAKLSLERLQELDYSKKITIIKLKICRKIYKELVSFLNTRQINFKTMFPDKEGFVKDLNFSLYNQVIADDNHTRKG